MFRTCITLIFLSGCGLFVQELHFVNNSDANIYYDYRISNYNDTILLENAFASKEYYIPTQRSF